MTTIRQPLHLLDRDVMLGMRKRVAPMKGSITGPAARKPFDELMETTPAAPRVPRASPLYANLAGLPPIRTHVGEDEVLLDDSTRYGDRVEKSGACQVNVWEGMVHVFPSNVSTLHAAKAALDDIGDFLRQCFKVETA
jgi:acetyl esterase/lipase